MEEMQTEFSGRLLDEQALASAESQQESQDPRQSPELKAQQPEEIPESKQKGPPANYCAEHLMNKQEKKPAVYCATCDKLYCLMCAVQHKKMHGSLEQEEHKVISMAQYVINHQQHYRKHHEQIKTYIDQHPVVFMNYLTLNMPEKLQEYLTKVTNDLSKLADLNIFDPAKSSPMSKIFARKQTLETVERKLYDFTNNDSLYLFST